MRARVAAVAAVAICGFVAGRWTAPGAKVEAPAVVPPETNEACCTILAQAQKDNYAMRQELVYQQQAVVVEKESCRALKDVLQERVDDISDLEEQLAFYRGIVSPEEVQSGVRIFGLDLQPVEDGVFQFQITLLQSVRHRRDVTGTVALTLQGLRGDDLVSLSGDDLAVGEAFAGDFSFRYYQELFGQLRVPADVRPLRLIVTVKTHGRSPVQLEQTYLWSELTGVPRDPTNQVQNGSPDE